MLRDRRLPDWFRKSLTAGHEASRTDALLKNLGLHTICESGRCPNRDECYSHKTATFMLMGDVCTRSCRFCSVTTGRPEALDPDEPRRVAEAAGRLGLDHVVVTSVDRDDLADEGAGHFAQVIRELRKVSRGITVEILTPDFRRTQRSAVRTILEAGPDIFGHNTETVPRLYNRLRPQGCYDAALGIFRQIQLASSPVVTKSGLMLGVGERPEEVWGVMADLLEAGCDVLTLGQYLQSDPSGLPVEEYIHPEAFGEYRQKALAMGFRWVESAPYVRSSFHAGESFEALRTMSIRRGVGADGEPARFGGSRGFQRPVSG